MEEGTNEEEMYRYKGESPHALKNLLSKNKVKRNSENQCSMLEDQHNDNIDKELVEEIAQCKKKDSLLVVVIAS